MKRSVVACLKTVRCRVTRNIETDADRVALNENPMPPFPGEPRSEYISTAL
ncbi:hypothetical protein [Stenotrophomonas phage CM2]